MRKKKGNNYIIDEQNGIAKIELKRRNEESIWTIIDLDDLDRIINYPYTWYALYRPSIDNYYVVSTVYVKKDDGGHTYKSVFLHQFICGNENGIVDHENHDPLDNRKSNLRDIPYEHNSKNRKSKNSNNKSGYRNVSWNKSRNAWVVQLQINKKNTELKAFPYEQLEEAGKYAEEMREKYYGKFKGES